jgi:phosphoglycolate phosphatase
LIFDALVFDLDGTLWDATAACLVGWNDALAALKLGKSLTIAELKRITGKPIGESIKILFPNEPKKSSELLDAITHFEKIALQNQGATLYDGLRETLEQLARGYDLYLVSNCREWYLELFWNFSKVKKYFQADDCYGKSGQNKAEMLKRLKEQYGLEKPAYIGDTAGDELAGRQAGYAFIHAAYGFGSPTRPEMVINSLPELVKLLPVEAER